MYERATDDEIRNSELGKIFEAAGNTGYSFEELWKKTNYVERADLSRDISRLLKLRIVVKRADAKYYREDAVAAEIKQILNVPVDPVETPPEPRVFTRKLETKPEPKAEPAASEEQPKALPYGTLRRGAAVTPIALTFYFNQQTDFASKDLVRRTGVGPQVVSQTLRRLSDEGYIYQSGGGSRSATFRWKGAFRYPFPESRPEDIIWYPFLESRPEDIAWRVAKIEKAVPQPNQATAVTEPLEIVGNVQVLGPTVVQGFGQDKHLQALDELIERHERELQALRIARNFYVSGTQAAA
jgi:DNA-binding Lrp family transcriptional regulator